jgi:predicted secreted protein
MGDETRPSDTVSHSDRDDAGTPGHGRARASDSLRRLDRRGFVRASAIVAAGLAFGDRLFGQALTSNAPRSFPRRGEGSATLASGPDDEMTDEVKQVLKAHFGNRAIKTGHVQFDIPTDAPDGRAVPVIIETDFPISATTYVAAYHIIVDHNPDIYLAAYHLSAACGEGPIETRIKMRRTSYVRAIAETNTGELWSAAVKVFVGLNGCG